MAERGVFRKIAAELARLIEVGELAPGAPVPSESELAARFGVARGTVRAALDVLARDGLLVVKPGRGRFVATQANETKFQASTVYESLAQAITARIIEEHLEPGTPLPSEATLMAEFDISRTTVRRAYKLLQEQGVVHVKQGSGAFVAGT